MTTKMSFIYTSPFSFRMAASIPAVVAGSPSKISAFSPTIGRLNWARVAQEPASPTSEASSAQVGYALDAISFLAAALMPLKEA